MKDKALSSLMAMAKALIWSFVFLTSFSSLAQVDKAYLKSRKAQQPKNLPPPPNGVWLYDNVFIDETEIANIYWLEYVHYLARDSSALDSITNMTFVEAIPWQLANQKVFTYKYDRLSELDDLASDYRFQYPGYRYFPMVGITHKQALAYCEWRSAAVNEKYVLPGAGDSLEVYFKFRLPTEKEWEMAAYGSRITTNYGMQNDTIEVDRKLIRKTKGIVDFRNKEGNFRPGFVSGYQFKSVGAYPLFVEGINKLSYIYEGEPNSLGLYNMIGNVAEMIDKDSIAKGGSWMHGAKSCKISDRQYYECPTEWLGFRCVCEVYVYRKGRMPSIKHKTEDKEHCQLVNEILIPELAVKKKLRSYHDSFLKLESEMAADGISIYLNNSLFSESFIVSDSFPKSMIFDVVGGDSVEIDKVNIIAAGTVNGGKSFFPRGRISFEPGRSKNLTYSDFRFYNPVFLLFNIDYRRKGQKKFVSLKRYLASASLPERP